MVDGAATAVISFLLSTVRRHWGSVLAHNASYEDLRSQLMTVLHKIETDLDMLRRADKDVATLRFTRGMHIFLSKPESDEEWKSDLKSALDSAENAYQRVKRTEEKIFCFEIMCSCFLLLRDGENAILSITSTLTEIFRDPVLENTLRSLKTSVYDGKPLPRAHKSLLELFFSRVCGIVIACQELSGYNAKHQDGFRQVFSTAELVTITDPEKGFSKWKDVMVYKHSASFQVAQVAAHALVPVVPVLSATATILSLGIVRPKKAGIRSFDTVPLVEKQTDEDQENVPNLFDFRFMLLDLVHCKSTHLYPLGDVSLRESLEGTTVTGSMHRTLPISEYALSDNDSTKLLEPKA